MKKRGLFIPGLFVSPGSLKYRTLVDALKPKADLHFLDFKDQYATGTFSYKDLRDQTDKRLETEYDFVIAHCMGCTLYADVISQEPRKQKSKSVLITPPGQLGQSEWWKNFSHLSNCHTIHYASNNYYPDGYDVSVKFYRDMGASSVKARPSFSQNTMAILATDDVYSSKNIQTELKEAGCRTIVEIDDDHATRKAVPDIAQHTIKFLMH
jgi:hypothetical protein